MSRLVFKFKDKILDSYALSSAQGIAIGRHRSNDIVIDNLAVSGYHARVDGNADGFTITDLQSKNGTYVNNERVTESKLGHKDTICIGKHTLLVDLLDELNVDETVLEGQPDGAAPMAISDEKTMILDTSQGRQLRGEEAAALDTMAEVIHPEKDCLCFLEGEQDELALSQKQVAIGKNSDADITVKGFWALFTGSPAATITKRAGDYFLRYAGGLIKPKRNGDSVKGTVKLNHDDIIEIGPVKIQIQLSQRTTSL